MGWFKKTTEFIQNAASFCLPFTPPTPEQQQKRLEKILAQIKKIPEGAALLVFLEEKKVKIIFSRDVRFASYSSGSDYSWGRCTPRPGEQYILFNPDRDDALLTACFFHEARHMQQVFSGVVRPDKQVSPFDLAWYIRVHEADAEASSVIVALKRKISGDSSLFDIEKMEYESMYRVAERQYARNPSSLDSGQLKRKVFDAWFSDPVKQIYDKRVISTDWPDSVYSTDLSEDGFSKSGLTCEDVQKIGAAGGESINYLTLPGFRPLDDPYYKGGFCDDHRRQLQVLLDKWEGLFSPEKKTPPKKSPDSGLGRQG
jgi:hypothetical protein